ncbi:hypothetical protein L1987_19961 [Smallanthus sonchifolius]|uniref:Uncharacterized protein n=1 Tax=Smallanthus sonchifolius TaxID=185202 RepID=A0ACB9IQY1_9ASTR|nr:hypothetical protein L1987_19961 [Smallanthus sonchifolius]
MAASIPPTAALDPPTALTCFNASANRPGREVFINSVNSRAMAALTSGSKVKGCSSTCVCSASCTLTAGSA